MYKDFRTADKDDKSMCYHKINFNQFPVKNWKYRTENFWPD